MERVDAGSPRRPRARRFGMASLALGSLLALAITLAASVPGARSATTHAARVISVSLVHGHIPNSKCDEYQLLEKSEEIVCSPPPVTTYMDPVEVSAKNGDVVRICNRTRFISSLFSPDRYNKLGGKAPGSGLHLRPGACASIAVHNPTAKPLRIVIADEIHTDAKVFVTIARCGPGEKCGTPPSQAGTFVLADKLTEVKNPNAPELTIDAAGGTADWDHTGQYGGAGNGGDWKVKYGWHVPQKLVAGETASVLLVLEVSNENPPQPLFVQMTAFAPDFAQALSIQAPELLANQRTYYVPISAGYKDAKELTITIGVVSANVVYHYERVGA